MLQANEKFIIKTVPIKKYDPKDVIKSE